MRVNFVSEILREKRAMKVFEERVLRIMCGPERDVIIGGWRKLHNGELYNSSIYLSMALHSFRWTLAAFSVS
jgi:hypothetical protein